MSHSVTLDAGSSLAKVTTRDYCGYFCPTPQATQNVWAASHAQFMTTAGARRSKSKKNPSSASRLWIDSSRLPTTLKRKEFTPFKLPPGMLALNRYLELADLALGNPATHLERRKNRHSQYRGIERRHLELADLVLGKPLPAYAIERRKNRPRDYRGIERRLSRK
jgi:hypothetical protein